MVDRRHIRSFPSLAPSSLQSPISEYPFPTAGRSTIAGRGSVRSFFFTADQFKTLQDMQRVLYRGYDNQYPNSNTPATREEIEEFISDHIDADCIYESPLLTLQNSKLLQHALNISHSVSSSYLPCLRPRSVVRHLGSVLSYGWQSIFGSPSMQNIKDELLSTPMTPVTKVESGLTPAQRIALSHQQHFHSDDEDDSDNSGSGLNLFSSARSTQDSISQKGRQAISSAFKRYHAHSHENVAVDAFSFHTALASREDPELNEVEPFLKNNRSDLSHDESQVSSAECEQDWWKAWDVRSLCGEVNEMETYDGFHFGFVEHTLILSILPHLLEPLENDPEAFMSTSTAHLSPFTSLSRLPSFSHSRPVTPGSNLHHHHSTINHPIGIRARYSETNPAPSLFTNLKNLVLQNILRYKLHLHTVVEFNEAGKIVYIRDLLDLRDVWEGLVPFGRESAWVGRRLGGMALAGLGRLVFGSSNQGRIEREVEEENFRGQLAAQLQMRAEREKGRGSGASFAFGPELDSAGVGSAEAPDVDSGTDGGLGLTMS